MSLLKFFLNRKKSPLLSQPKEKLNNHNTFLAHRDLEAIPGCKRELAPFDDTCLKCGECGRFNSDFS